MTVTYLLRHGRTQLSAVHQVNGDPDVPVALDEVGRSQCQAVADDAWIGSIVTSVTSRFLRTRQTADHLLGTHRSERIIEPRLDEVRYGTFEGGPWLTYGAWLTDHGPLARPPSSGESLYEATVRQLDGLAAVLDQPAAGGRARAPGVADPVVADTTNLTNGAPLPRSDLRLTPRAVG